MNSIRTRFLLVLLAVGLIPMVFVILVTNQRTRDSLEESEREKIAAVTYEVARQARLVMDSAVNDLVALQGNRIVTDSSIPMDIRVEEMKRLVAAYKMFDDITLYDSKGVIVRSTTNENHPEPKKNLGLRTVFLSKRLSHLALIMLLVKMDCISRFIFLLT